MALSIFHMYMTVQVEVQSTTNSLLPQFRGTILVYSTGRHTELQQNNRDAMSLH